MPLFSTAMDANCAFVESTSVRNLTFENVVELVTTKVAQMDSYSMADAFNAATLSDIEYDDDGDTFIVDGEEVNHHELLSNLKHHLKFESREDVLEVYQQICKENIFYFHDSDTYVYKS
ncbi:hypothetical protein [Photobacterium damselae]|uniref:hypothetical protein n=1 Tax=Photobacterium damselae TaxID=38293 RepID=UPI00406761BF